MELERLTDLRSLALDQNKLEGECNLHSALAFVAPHIHRLRSYSRAGPIPSAIGQLVNLKELHLSHNPSLGGQLPAGLWSLAGLEVLNLYQNRLGAFDYSAVGPMTALGILTLNNQAGGDLGCGGLRQRRR